MGCPMMTEERPTDFKNWSPEHVRQYLEEHMNDSGYDEIDIKKIYDQNVDGYSFFTILTIEALTNKYGPFEIKFGPASHIMKLVREKREENTPAHVEVVTSSEFIKFREDTIAEMGQLKEKLVSIPSSNEFVNAATFKKFSEGTTSKIAKLNNELSNIKTDVDDKYKSLTDKINDLAC